MLVGFNNDQDLCDMMINVFETGAASAGSGEASIGPSLAPTLVYTNNHVLYKHS